MDAVSSHDRPLRIALVGTRGVPARYGGFETCIEEVGQRLAARGHKVVVYCRETASTDKAVTPATVMGASKALSEFAVEGESQRFPQTRYATVRFGNVLGSSGSVVPIFRRQIAKGGPVTLTDRRMTRYFMTIPEAVQLIIRSGSLGKGGEIFVLDMGEAVSIEQLAKDMIELSGLRPGEDIAVEEIGRRPGEKLHEELFNPYEHPQPTPAEKISRADRDALDPTAVDAMFDDINLLVLEGDAATLARKVQELSSIHQPSAVRAGS